MNRNLIDLSSMLSTSDVAGIFGVSPCTVRRWSDEGKLIAYCSGRRKFFSRMDVAAAFLHMSILSLL